MARSRAALAATRELENKVKELAADLEQTKNSLEGDLEKKGEVLREDLENLRMEIEDAKEKFERSQGDMLRNLVSIFGIFVAIFSFIVIGSTIALSIEPKEVKGVCYILGLVAVILVVLLYIIKRWFLLKDHKRK